MNRQNQDMQQKRMNQKELYEWIMMLGFCAVDMMLYLDTHPDDEEALNYFNQCNTLYNAAKQSYQEQFGLLNAFSEQERFSWDWNTAPMPWEGGM
ncbi:MAG: spore coat protein CotJB [Lachnobacterium sp.]|uniref:spore coat protein CotJB n=1 Tax=Agathobacter sp. TaxID=2021311 RepID=UPI003063D652|nr:spore coat protein CotJB [Lachnobacterium sp.]